MVREYISWFENLDIYQEWVKDLPEPLCNAAFASAVFLGAAIFLLTAAVNRILLARWNARQRKARWRMEEQRRQEAEEQRERDRRSREDREQMDLYLRFLMTAQMQNFTSLQGITFGQWKSQMLVEQAADGAGRTAGNAGEETRVKVEQEPGDEADAGKETGVEIRAEDETGDGINAGGECSTEWEKAAEADAADMPDMAVGLEEYGMEPGKRNVESGQGDMKPWECSGETEDVGAGQEKAMERGEPEPGLMPEGERDASLFGNLGLPEKRTADDAAGETAGQKASPESLRSVDMAAVMEQIRRDGESAAAGGLSSEQQSDFAKVLAQMREDAERQDYLERFQREKSEIIKNNLSVLDRTVYPTGEDSTAGKSTERKAADEEMERRKAAAREAIRQEERLAQEKGKKKGMFRRKK